MLNVFSKLSQKEQQIILQCMIAISKGNFLEDEVQTRIGIDEKDLQKIIDDFPEINDCEDGSNETLAINNCLNEICNGLAFSASEWQKWFSVDRDEIVKTHIAWTNLRGWKRTGII